MATRTLHAPDGTVWEIWDVLPGLQLEQRRGRGMLLPDAMAGGWLCFEGPEKRRLYPIPDRWEALADEDLWGMCREAQAVPPRRGASV